MHNQVLLAGVGTTKINGGKASNLQGPIAQGAVDSTVKWLLLGQGACIFRQQAY